MNKLSEHKDIYLSSSLREIVFGMEDGMVSTLGAITGIAVGSQDHFTILLAGTSIIAVEAISMGLGSYLSNQSGREVDLKRLAEEKKELIEFPQEEKAELLTMLLRDGWSQSLAKQMASEADKNKDLMLKEMAYRELKITTTTTANSFRLGLYMFFSYIIGGAIPLMAYFALPAPLAMRISIPVTLAGLFTLGIVSSRYTKTSWLLSGLRVLAIGGTALIIGLLIGSIASLLR